MKPIIIYLLLIGYRPCCTCLARRKHLMMIKLSEAHGPSTLDLIGIAIIFIGYIPLIIPLFTRFSTIQHSIGKQLSLIIVGAIVLFSSTIAIGLAIESEALLWTSVAITTLLQSVLVYFAYKRNAA